MEANQSQATEVDLELVPGLAVIDRNGLAAIAETELRDAEAMQGPVRHDDTAPAQQNLDLRQAPVVLELRLDECSLAVELGPTVAVPSRSSGTQLLNDCADYLFTDPTQPTREARLDRDLDISTHGLAVDPEQPLDLAVAAAHLPEPQHLSYLRHGHLPEHAHLLISMDEGTVQGLCSGHQGWSLVLG
jgi:hypothetical protein